MLIESGNNLILIDPMLGDKGTAAPPFTLFRFKPKRNPTVDLPSGVMERVNKSTHCLITHLHADHLDTAGKFFLKETQLPITCNTVDESILKQNSLNISQTIDYWESIDFLGGKITGIPARHGYGYIAKLMGSVMGYFIQLPNEKSLYLSSDTIFTEDVRKVLTELKPDISVLACGSAQMDLFKPILMHMDDILKFFQTAPGKVIANHLEAVNHCPTSRIELKRQVESLGLTNKVWIPEDGELKNY